MNGDGKQQFYLNTLLQLFLSFLRIGPVTFGGGYAMIPIIEREVVTKHGWMDTREMNDVLSIAGSAPGGVGVNAAAFIGYRLGGVLGAIVAIVGMTIPTFLIVLLLSLSYSWFDDNPKVIAALKGIHGAIIGLILVAAYKVIRTSLFDKTTIGITIITLVLLLGTSINPTFIILFGLCIGIIIIKAKGWIGLKAYTERPANLSRKELMTPEYYI
ncbi:MAG: chromate transporter [Candidatus Pristimantibacillus sp.]